MRSPTQRSLLGRSACVALTLLALAAGPGLRAQDVVSELGAPLSQEERDSVATLEHALGATDPAQRERAAELVRKGPGVRAASFLLELAAHEADPEARFRARALVQSLLMRKFLETPCGPAWL